MPEKNIKKMTPVRQLSVECSVRRALEVIGGKWRLRILDACAERRRRYGELRRLLPDVSEKMLIQELKALAAHGLLKKKSFPEIPPRVEYTLTAQGKKILPVIALLREFGKDFMKGA